MHIALYTPGWPVEDFQNGIVTYVKQMRTALLALGHQVTVVAGTIGSSNTDSDVFQVTPEPATKALMRVRRKLGILRLAHFGQPLLETFERIHKQRPIDIIEMEESFGHVRALKPLRIPTIVKLHGPAFLSLLEEERESDASKLKIEVEGLCLSAERFITSPSVATLEDTVAKYNLTGHCQHARNPIDPAPMPVWSVDVANPDTALFVGRFDMRKGADRVLQAFKLVLEQKPRARLIFVGPDRGVPGPDGTVLNFESFAKSLFSPEQFKQILFGGPQKPADIEQLRLKARVTLIASRWESAGYTAAEALAQGCPVVSMRCDGVDEVVLHNNTGLVSQTVEEFAANILRLMGDPVLASQLGTAGRGFIERTHAPAVAAEAALAIYRQAIGSFNQTPQSLWLKREMLS